MSTFDVAHFYLFIKKFPSTLIFMEYSVVCIRTHLRRDIPSSSLFFNLSSWDKHIYLLGDYFEKL